MWPINYEDPDKLHISGGIGLMVAAFLLLSMTAWNTFYKMSEFQDFLHETDARLHVNVSEETSGAQLYVDALSEFAVSLYRISYVLFIVGFGIFSIGYVGYVANNWKKSGWYKISSWLMKHGRK